MKLTPRAVLLATVAHLRRFPYAKRAGLAGLPATHDAVLSLLATAPVFDTVDAAVVEGFLAWVEAHPVDAVPKLRQRLAAYSADSAGAQRQLIGALAGFWAQRFDWLWQALPADAVAVSEGASLDAPGVLGMAWLSRHKDRSDRDRWVVRGITADGGRFLSHLYPDQAPPMMGEVRVRGTCARVDGDPSASYIHHLEIVPCLA